LSVSQIFISVIQKEKEWRFFPRTVRTCSRTYPSPRYNENNLSLNKSTGGIL
jgi:hypothetical protein